MDAKRALLNELQEVLGPMLCKLGAQENSASVDGLLNFAERQLWEYCERIWNVRGRVHFLTYDQIERFYGEYDDGDDATDV